MKNTYHPATSLAGLCAILLSAQPAPRHHSFTADSRSEPRLRRAELGTWNLNFEL